MNEMTYRVRCYKDGAYALIYIKSELDRPRFNQAVYTLLGRKNIMSIRSIKDVAGDVKKFNIMFA